MKKFRTMELSTPEFESDHLRNIKINSANLNGRGDICVFIPPGIELISDVPPDHFITWGVWQFLELVK